MSTKWANYIRGLGIQTRTAGLEFRESLKAAAEPRTPTTSDTGLGLLLPAGWATHRFFFSAQRRSAETWIKIFWVLLKGKELFLSPILGVKSRRSPFLQHGCKKVRVDGEAINRTDRTEMESWADCFCRVHDPSLSSEIRHTTTFMILDILSFPVIYLLILLYLSHNLQMYARQVYKYVLVLFCVNDVKNNNKKLVK